MRATVVGALKVATIISAQVFELKVIEAVMFDRWLVTTASSAAATALLHPLGRTSISMA